MRMMYGRRGINCNTSTELAKWVVVKFQGLESSVLKWPFQRSASCWQSLHDPGSLGLAQKKSGERTRNWKTGREIQVHGWEKTSVELENGGAGCG